MKVINYVLIATLASILLLACQSSEMTTAPLLYTLEPTTTQPTITRTLTPTPKVKVVDTPPKEAATLVAPTSKATETTTPSLEHSDSQKIAFISKMSGQTDLWWMDSNGSNLDQLTDDSQIERWPAWSPGGNVLAYATRPHSTIATSDLLWALDIQSKRKLQLVDSPLIGISAPTWSPDSRVVAYSTWITDIPHIWVINVETIEQVKITQHRQNPVWSPDGKKLAVLGPPIEIEFGASAPVDYFSVIAINGEPFDHLHRGWDWQKHVTGMSWSHLGDRLLVTAEAGKAFYPGVASLEIIETENKTASITVNHVMKCNDYDCDFYSPSWFPNDKEILFIAAVPLPLRAPYDTPEPDEPEGRWWLYRATDDLASIQAVFESDIPISDASLSPDGTQVVFVQGEYSEAEIWILDLSTGEATQLTNNRVNDSNPVWQPES